MLAWPVRWARPITTLRGVDQHRRRPSTSCPRARPAHQPRRDLMRWDFAVALRLPSRRGALQAAAKDEEIPTAFGVGEPRWETRQGSVANLGESACPTCLAGPVGPSGEHKRYCDVTVVFRTHVEVLRGEDQCEVKIRSREFRPGQIYVGHGGGPRWKAGRRRGRCRLRR